MVFDVIARSGSDVAIRISYAPGAFFEGQEKRDGLPHQCAHWFAMTGGDGVRRKDEVRNGGSEPPPYDGCGGRYKIKDKRYKIWGSEYLISYISYLVSLQDNS